MRLAFHAAVALAAFTVTAHADTTIDQQSTFDGYFLDVTGSVGQSFNPTTGKINFATFNFYMPSNVAVTASLLAGDGLGGAVIANSTNAALLTSGGDIPFTFTFADTFLLAETYTLALNTTSGTSLRLDDGSGNYSGAANFNGTEYYSGGAITGYSARFSEGSTSAAAVTPEPSSLVLLGTGVMGLIGVARRRWA